jgi:2-C-methyl-D-erythritol 2,4-cyclodiphosphate synthase
MPRKARGTSPPATSDAALRVGIGYDSHRFALGRPLTLGGILIPSEIGLAGHSDADAICHALTDAILGAAGLGDIGEMFPDSDPANKDRDSIGMLEAAVRRLAAAGYEVSQVDVSVIAETPRLAPHRAKMRARLATALGIDSASVSVKGKTNEGMGWIGRKEGLACIAVAMLKGNR